MSQNALFIAQAIDDPNVLVSHYVISLLSQLKYLQKYENTSTTNQEQIVAILENHYRQNAQQLSAALLIRLYEVIRFFEPSHALLKEMNGNFHFLGQNENF